MRQMFNLINELAEPTEIFLTEVQDCIAMYGDIMLTESVQQLADKFQNWLNNKNITPEDLGALISGISLLVSSEGRSVITRDDLVNMGLQGDLKRAEKIDNADLNSMIRKQIIHLGRMRATKLSSMVTDAINKQQYTQIRNYLLKLSVYVDRIKNKEKYVKQDPHVMKSERRAVPSVPNQPTNAQG